MFAEFKKLVDSIVLFQALLLVLFLLFNFDSLQAITIRIEIGSASYDIVIDLLVTSILSVLVFVTIIVVASLNIFGSGLSETGIIAIAKFMALLTLFVHFMLAEGWLLQHLSAFGTILFVFFRFADILYFVVSLET